MRKRKHEGKTYYVFTDADYERVVGVMFDDPEKEEESINIACYGCVDRYKDGCPTKDALKIKGTREHPQTCFVRILDEEGLSHYIAKRLNQ